MADVMYGGFTGVRDADVEIQKICDEVKRQVEEKTNKTYTVFKAVQYRSQVVQGVNYAIKVHVGGCTYLHVLVWKKLPCYGGEAAITHIEVDRSKDDPIVPSCSVYLQHSS